MATRRRSTSRRTSRSARTTTRTRKTRATSRRTTSTTRPKGVAKGVTVVPVTLKGYAAKDFVPRMAAWAQRMGFKLKTGRARKVRVV